MSEAGVPYQQRELPSLLDQPQPRTLVQVLSELLTDYADQSQSQTGLLSQQQSLRLLLQR